MEYKDITIGENVTVHYFPTEKFKSNFISIDFITPLCVSDAAEKALLFDVLTRGTEKYPTLRELNTRLDDLYGMGLHTSCAKSGPEHVVGFSLDMLSNSHAFDSTDIASEAIELIDEIVNHPVLENGLLRSDYTEQEKEKLCDKIESLILRKSSYAISRCGEKMYADEIYGISANGTVESVSAITPESLTKCYHALLEEARIDIFCIGSFSDSHIEKLGGVFSECGKNYKADSRVKFEANMPEAVREFEEVKEIAQATMALGFRVGCSRDDGIDCSPIVVLNSIFGGGTVSKLFMNVREKMSLCYYCQSLIRLRSGTMYVVTGVDGANITKTREAVLDQLNEIAKGNISDEEFEYSKRELATGLRSVADSPSDIEGWYLNRILSGIDSTPEKELEKIKAVTKEQISEAAKKIKLDTVFVLRGNGDTGEAENEN